MTLTEIRAVIRDGGVQQIGVRTAMELQDDLPVEWRELIYQHGQTKVFSLLAMGATLERAREVLGA